MRVAKRRIQKAGPSRRRVFLALSWYEMPQMIGILRYAYERQWTLGYWDAGQPYCIERFRPDGILCQLHKGTPDLIAAASAAKTPKVSLGDFYVAALRMPLAREDHAATGSLAAAHLVERGFRRLVYVGGGPESPFLAGFKRVADQHNCELITVFLRHDPAIAHAVGEDLPHHSLHIHDELSPRRQEWAGDYFASCPKPAGVFADHFVWASEIIEGCVAAGILVPEQIAMVSYSVNEHEGEYFAVPTTIVVPDCEKQAYQAAALLDRMMDGERVKSDFYMPIPPKCIIPRDSTLVHAANDIAVARATRYIMQNLHRANLSAIQVCARTGTPSSTLYRMFTKQIRMPIADYIETLRIKEATQLLDTTSRTATDIAAHCGFSELKHFRRALRRQTSMAPDAYRTRHRNG